VGLVSPVGLVGPVGRVVPLGCVGPVGSVALVGDMWIDWKKFRGGQPKGWRVLRGLATRIDYGN